MANQPTPEQVMKACQVGTNNYNDANNLHAKCYGTIGLLLIHQEKLISHIDGLINCADPNRDINEIREAKKYIKQIRSESCTSN